MTDGAVAHALVVVDVQRAFVNGPQAVPAATPLLTAVEQQLDRARAAGCLVVHLQNHGDPGAPDQPGTDGWCLAHQTAPGETVIGKTDDDGFEGTDLEELLTAAGARTLSICGLMSEMCVAATARGALRHGFSVVLARDAHATQPVPDQGPRAPAVPAHLVARVAEWSLGDEVVVVDESSEITFTRP
ncbi:isochorismatase family protein [Nocardioides sediminis]|uniref:isochorismatase family protein n=1 Tax=Nocardioides sediminis TaxID=433648 RepID=UPI000D31F852|nr:isochorismatase family protein [Nocardioides sediminis]